MRFLSLFPGGRAVRNNLETFRSKTSCAKSRDNAILKSEKVEHFISFYMNGERYAIDTGLGNGVGNARGLRHRVVNRMAKM